MSGVASLGRGRKWHDEAEGPTFPSERLVPFAGLLRSGTGRIAVAALPIQLFGLVQVLVAILMMVGVVPSEQAPRLAVAVLVAGIFLVTLATVVMRVVVWFGRRGRGG